MISGLSILAGKPMSLKFALPDIRSECPAHIGLRNPEFPSDHEGLTPALNAARTAFICPSVNAGSSSLVRVCRGCDAAGVSSSS
jgi:hypothetical protein